jgi:hypothetical protein
MEAFYIVATSLGVLFLALIALGVLAAASSK